MNGKISDRDAMDLITRLVNANEWNSDLMDPVFRVIAATGRIIEDIDADEGDEDRSSSVSRQHYIDTGRYLTHEEVGDA
jgi:hypothetical protein